MENPHRNNEQDELIIKLLKTYDNVRHEDVKKGKTYTYTDDMTIYDLTISEPHIIFVILSKTSNGEGIMKFHAMNLKSLIYFLSDVGRIYTNWVINENSSEFGKLLLGQGTNDALSLSDTTGDFGYRDVLGNHYLNMDGLNEGRGGKQGRRRFFKLEFNFGGRFIDAESVDKLQKVSRSKIFILNPKFNPYSTLYGKPYVLRTEEEIEIEKNTPIDNNVIYEEIRYGSLQSNFGISESHGQKHRGGEVLYELIDYEELKAKIQQENSSTVVNQTNFLKELSDRIITITSIDNLLEENSVNDTKHFKDLPELHDMLMEKFKYEEEENKISFINKISRTDTTDNERDQMNYILTSFWFSLEYDKELYFFQDDYQDDYSYIFSENNIDKTINIISKKLIFPIYIQNIPKSKPIYFLINNNDMNPYDIKKYLILRINGVYKIGMVTYIYSNLTGRDDEDDEMIKGEEDYSDSGSDSEIERLGIHPNKGHWIYKVSFTDRIPILIGEKANDDGVVNNIIVPNSYLTNKIQEDGEPFALKSYNECQEILRNESLNIDIPLNDNFLSNENNEIDTTDYVFTPQDVIDLLNKQNNIPKIKRTISNFDLSTSFSDTEVRSTTPPPSMENLQPRPPFPPQLESPLRGQNTSTQNVPIYANALWHLQQQSNQSPNRVLIRAAREQQFQPISDNNSRHVTQLLGQIRNAHEMSSSEESSPINRNVVSRSTNSSNSLIERLNDWNYDIDPDVDPDDDGGELPENPEIIREHYEISQQDTPPSSPRRP